MAKTATVPSTEFKQEFTPGSAAAAAKAAAAKSNDMLMVPIENLVAVAGLNVRIHDAAYEEHVQEIENSIIENGFYRHKALPGYAAKEGDTHFIYITGGFTRLDAAKRAKKAGAPIEMIPVILHPSGRSMADLTLALAMDNTGEPLRPLEKAIVMKRLVNFGTYEADIAKKMSVSGQYVKDLLYLVSLPQNLINLVVDGSASAGTVIQLARKHGAAEAVKIIKGVAAEGGQGASQSTGNGSAAASPARVTTGRVAASQAGASGIVPKGHYIAAIDYAIDLPGDGIDFLRRWRNGEKDAEKELAATLTKEGKAATRKSKREREKAAEKAKKAAAKEKAKAEAEAKKTAAAVRKAAKEGVAKAGTAPTAKEDDAFSVDL